MTRILKSVFYVFFFLLIISVLPAYSEQTPTEQLKLLIADLQKNPDDFALQEKIIKHVQTMKPAPTIPEEARRHFVMAASLQKKAKDEKGFELAIEEYRQSLLLAPWWPEAYYNLGIALESANKYDDAIKALKLYLTTGPKEGDAREAQDRIYAIEAARKLARTEAVEAKKKEEAKPDFSGIWRYPDPDVCYRYKFLITGREFTITTQCGNRSDIWGTGVMDGRNFEGTHPGGVSATGHTSFPKRFKGTLSEDNKTIEISEIIAPELAVTKEAREAASIYIRTFGSPKWGKISWTRGN